MPRRYWNTILLHTKYSACAILFVLKLSISPNVIVLGRKFAMAQIKAAIATILSKFELRVSKKVIEPLELDPAQFLHAVKGGIWLNMYKRTST